MSKLTLVDDLFLLLESRRAPLHIGILMLFDPPADAPPLFAAQLAERLRQSFQATPPFNQRLTRRSGMHAWEADDEFDLDHHFVHTSLPRPGRTRELLALVSRTHSVRLDRTYPLWRMYLIEGLSDGRIAVYLKMHHAVVDGVGGMRLLLRCMSNDAMQSAQMPPPWGVKPSKPKKLQALPVPRPAMGGLAALRLLAREGIHGTGPVLREMRDTFSDVRHHDPDVALVGQAPRSLFKGRISPSRRFAAQQYATSRMRGIAQALDATLNDVVLAMCGGALRRYLLQRGDLPEKPLIAGVPVSIRRDSNALGNEVAFTITHLATHMEDAVERLLAIKRCMDKSKQRLRKLSPSQVMAYAMMMLMPGAIGTLLSRSSDRALGNVVVSHIPGPREDLYWQGCRLAGLYPASLLIDMLTLNITVISRHDFVDFGLIACRKSVPHAQRLLEHLEDELAALEAGVAQRSQPKPRRRTARHART
jgi:diacylglycerol O-acyltransferase